MPFILVSDFSWSIKCVQSVSFLQIRDLEFLMKFFNFYTLNGLVLGFNTSRQKGEIAEDVEVQTISLPTAVEVPLKNERKRSKSERR